MADIAYQTDRQTQTEPRLRTRFRAWLDELDDAQLAALDENWDNVMDDAALDRIDSWVIATRTLARLRGELPKDAPAVVARWIQSGGKSDG